MLTEKQTAKITIINNNVDVELTTIIEKDGAEFAKNTTLYTIFPGQDYSKEPAEVQAICKAVHTKAVVDAYKKQVTNGTT